MEPRGLHLEVRGGGGLYAVPDVGRMADWTAKHFEALLVAGSVGSPTMDFVTSRTLRRVNDVPLSFHVPDLSPW